MTTAFLLVLSNIFMTFAWYWHLKQKDLGLWVVILISWGMAGVEYCFAVPANRIGHQAGMSAGQLKIMQEVITLAVFAVFSATYLKERLTWNYYVAFGFILVAVWLVFAFKPDSAAA